MLNEDLNNQTDELFPDTKNILEDYKSGKKKPVPMSEVFTLENVKKNLLPQFRTKEEIIEKAKATDPRIAILHGIFNTIRRIYIVSRYKNKV